MAINITLRTIKKKKIPIDTATYIYTSVFMQIGKLNKEKEYIIIYFVPIWFNIQVHMYTYIICISCIYYVNGHRGLTNYLYVTII